MKKYILFSICIVFVTNLFSQTKTMNRSYVPLQHSELGSTALNGIVINQWTAFKYDAHTEEWQQVLFQIDERDHKDRYNRDDQDDIADSNDVVVVMPKDLGDQAPASVWLPEADRNTERIELAFTDSLDGGQGWVYLYQHTPDYPVPFYVWHAAAPEDAPAADTVKSDNYSIAHNAQGWLDYIALSENPGVDLIDRLKLRLAGSNPGLFISRYVIHENYIEPGDPPVQFTPGPIRAFQTVKAKISLDFLSIPFLPKYADSPYHFQYFPYSFEIDGETDLESGLLALFGLKTLRQSLDMSPAASGMVFYSADNPDGYVVDGETDSPDLDFTGDTNYNWVMVSGDQGTIVLLFDLPDIPKSTKKIYYRDNKNSSETNDDTPDTGDMESYGDMGIWVQATGDALVTSDLAVSFIGYFLPATNQTAQLGEQLAAWQASPPVMQAEKQSYEVSTVQRSGTPKAFNVAPMYPNPFYPNATQATMNIRNDGRSFVDVRIVNVLGQEVKNWQLSGDARQHNIRWNGRHEDGQPVPSGVYFVTVNATDFNWSQKLIVTR